MVRGVCIPHNPCFWQSVPNGGLLRLHVPFLGVLISGKKVLVFFGDAWPARHVPKTGILIFGKQGWAISGVQSIAV